MKARAVRVPTKELLAKARQNPLVAPLSDTVLHVVLVAGVTVATYRQAEILGAGREDLAFVAIQSHELAHRVLKDAGIETVEDQHKVIEVFDELLSEVLTKYYEQDAAEVAVAEGFTVVES